MFQSGHAEVVAKAQNGSSVDSEVIAWHLCTLLCVFVVRGVSSSKSAWKPGLGILGIPVLKLWHFLF